MKYFIQVLVLGLVVSLTLADPFLRKKLAGPPEEFKYHVIPNPSGASVNEESAAFVVHLAMTKGLNPNSDLVYQVDLPVDGTLVTLGFFSPYENSVDIHLYQPNGKEFNLESIRTKTIFPISSSGEGAEGSLYTIPHSTKGFWQMKIYAKSTHIFNRAGVEDTKQNAMLLWYNESPLLLNIALNSYDLLVGNSVGLRANLLHPLVSNASQLVVDIADMFVEMPDGAEVDVPMHDDGKHDDAEANDGIYGATIQATEPGLYNLKAVFAGKNILGHNYVRTSQQLVEVVTKTLELTGTATSKVTTDQHVDISLNVQVLNDEIITYTAYTEVWGYTSKGVATPVCWLGGIVDVTSSNGQPAVTLELNLNWVTKAKVVPDSIFLKNARVMELNSHIAVSIKAEIKILHQSNIVSTTYKLHPIDTITKEMRTGVMPVDFCNPVRNDGRNFTAPKRGVITSHGYCATSNYWKTQSEDWQGTVLHLEDLKQNRRNDAFAKKLLEFAESQQMTHFSLVGHSQGGLCILHIHNYYFSGVECAQNGRLLQSVGTPFKGNSGAGVGADLIKLFGISCGSNEDLTKSGATLWLKDIAIEHRKNVYYYRTSYPDGFLQYCNLATQLILNKPNDGLAEENLSVLDEGVNLGVKDKWCHAISMKYQPQCLDRDRNREMSALAAR